MRYPDGHKEAVRASIVQIAARALRRDGLRGISIPALMKEAGLTHGGFYVHFANRDELVVDAVKAAAEETATSVLPRDGAGFDTYLSMPHVDHPEMGCVLAALGPEAQRESGQVRDAFAGAARRFVKVVDRAMSGGTHAGKSSARRAPSDEALSRAATLIGSVVLARLVDDPALATRIVDLARRA